jgi:hypothetical protein
MESNTVLDIVDSSPRVVNSSCYGIKIRNGSPTITYTDINNWQNFDNAGVGNVIGLLVNGGGSPVIANCSITGVIISGGSPSISYCKLTRGSNNSNYAVINIRGGEPIIFNNNISSGTYSWVTGFFAGSQEYPGIVADGGNSVIFSNDISGCTLGIVAVAGTIERNLVINNTDVGIEIGTGTVNNNTIKDTKIGIKFSHSSGSTVAHFNNIENCSQYRVCLEETSSNINATHNWWGTTDLQAINQTTFGFFDDFTLGKVEFVSVLTEPNLEATPTSDPKYAPIVDPAIPEFPLWILPLFLTTTLVAVYARKRLTKF